MARDKTWRRAIRLSHSASAVLQTRPRGAPRGCVKMSRRGSWDVDMARDDWPGALRNLARGLIDIEANTVLSTGITGRKMPAYPHALHDILGKYASFMAYQVGIDVDAFCDEFRRRFGHPPLSGVADAAVGEDPDKASAENDREARGIELDFALARFSTPLTNGPWSFYLMRWLAANALAQRRIGDENLSVVTRIQVNSDHLKIVTRQLGELGPGGRNPYIGVPREQILHLEADPARPALPPAPPEALTMIRKLWDIGADSIVFQTVQQLDGDVIFRVRRSLDLTRRPALLEAHQDACKVAMSYWRSMFELIAALASGLADRIFGPSGPRGGGAV
jgi:hypothetical protein